MAAYLNCVYKAVFFTTDHTCETRKRNIMLMQKYCYNWLKLFDNSFIITMGNVEVHKLFLELLLVTMGEKDSLSRTPLEEEWKLLLEEAWKLDIGGVMLDGLERLPVVQRPPKMVLLQWIGQVQLIEQKTLNLTKIREEVIGFFQNNGFSCMLLKGATVGRYYPRPERRQSGDIDVWVNSGRKKLYDFARKQSSQGILYDVTYHHVGLHILVGVLIEAHIWPSFLSSPLRNNRLHIFFSLYRPTNDTTMPPLAFDRVFIMVHCYRHMCGHGLGLRQIMDYYYVLKKGFNEKEREYTVFWIRKLGMTRFAQGLMWVLKYCFGMKDGSLLMKPNKKEGSFIMQEVMLTGDIENSDFRNWGLTKSAISRFLRNIKRDIYLAKHYPHEALWQPFFSIWLYCWRLSKGLLKDSNNKNNINESR